MIHFDDDTDGEILPGTAVTITTADESSAARVEPTSVFSPVAGIAARVDGGEVQVATSGIVRLEPEQWTPVAGGPLVPGVVYWSGENGLLTRRPLATRVGVAISPTDLLVDIRPTAVAVATWPRELPAEKQVNIADLGGLRVIRGIWSGVTRVVDGYDTARTVAIEIDDRVAVFEAAGNDACTIYAVTRDEYAALVQLGAPAIPPIDPPIVANVALRERLRRRVLRAFDERTGLCVLEIGTELDDDGPSLAFGWDLSGLVVEP